MDKFSFKISFEVSFEFNFMLKVRDRVSFMS